MMTAQLHELSRTEASISAGAVRLALGEQCPAMTRAEMAENLLRPLGGYFAAHPRARGYLHDAGKQHEKFWNQSRLGPKSERVYTPISAESAATLAKAAIALDGSIRPMLALTACYVLDGAMLNAANTAQIALAAHGDRGLGGASLIWLALILQSTGEHAALSHYRAAAGSDVPELRRAALWGGALCAAANHGSSIEIQWFVDRLRDHEPDQAARSLEVVKSTLTARSGACNVAGSMARVEQILRGRNMELVDVLYRSERHV